MQTETEQHTKLRLYKDNIGNELFLIYLIDLYIRDEQKGIICIPKFRLQSVKVSWMCVYWELCSESTSTQVSVLSSSSSISFTKKSWFFYVFRRQPQQELSYHSSERASAGSPVLIICGDSNVRLFDDFLMGISISIEPWCHCQVHKTGD